MLKGFGVWGLGFGDLVLGFGFRVPRCWVQGFGDLGLGFAVSAVGVLGSVVAQGTYDYV